MVVAVIKVKDEAAETVVATAIVVAAAVVINAKAAEMAAIEMLPIAINPPIIAIEIIIGSQAMSKKDKKREAVLLPFFYDSCLLFENIIRNFRNGFLLVCVLLALLSETSHNKLGEEQSLRLALVFYF